MASFGGAVKLTGESEYRAALRNISQRLKEVSSELKLVSSQYDKNDTSIEALTAKQAALTHRLEEQKRNSRCCASSMRRWEASTSKTRRSTSS